MEAGQVQLITMVETLFNNPPINFNPELQTLKGWAMYCLRDRGFKVVYAQNADFAIETRTGDKIYFNVAKSTQELNGSVGWIVHDRDTNRVSVIAPQS